MTVLELNKLDKYSSETFTFQKSHKLVENLWNVKYYYFLLLSASNLVVLCVVLATLFTLSPGFIVRFHLEGLIFPTTTTFFATFTQYKLSIRSIRLSALLLVLWCWVLFAPTFFCLFAQVALEPHLLPQCPRLTFAWPVLTAAFAAHLGAPIKPPAASCEL